MLKQLNFLSLILFIIGLFFLFLPQNQITGSFFGTIYPSIAINPILGFMFIIVSLIIFLGKKTLEYEVEVKKDDYFISRAREIFNPRYNGQDVWVSRWELDGLINQIKNGTNGSGHKLYRDVSIEHYKDTPGMHPLGTHKMLHINVQVEDRNNRYIKRHLLITNDPYDNRLKRIGIITTGKTDAESEWGPGRDIGKVVNSRVYDPEHERHTKKNYRRAIDITYERNND